MKVKELFKLTGIPVLIASLCCLSPLILVMLGLTTVAFASSLSDILYGDYKWVFRSVGLILLLITTIFYLRRKKGICTIDEAKKRRNEIINIVLSIFIAGVIGYIFFLYVVVHYLGVFAGVWS